jgi:hypothetical protein
MDRTKGIVEMSQPKMDGVKLFYSVLVLSKKSLKKIDSLIFAFNNDLARLAREDEDARSAEEPCEIRFVGIQAFDPCSRDANGQRLP